MKKLLFNTFSLLAACIATGQIANGSDAPDFTVNDINGNPHTLSAYLAQGKTVIIDISATWCSPCWDYHNSGALEKLYYTIGPGGSGEAVVLFVEGDSNTPVESLYGIGGTYGDWTAHSSYPIIDSALLSDLYQITYFPTIFRICPDGKVSTVGMLGIDGLIASINNNCETVSPPQNNAKLTIDDLRTCADEQVVPQVSMLNYGIEVLTSATIQLKEGDNILAVKEYTGSINQYEETSVNFDPVYIAPGSNYEAVITNINQAVPANTETSSHQFDVTHPAQGYNAITVKVYTDNYPAEISWVIKNGSGIVVASGGPYQPLEQNSTMGGGPDANTVKTHDIVLPGTSAECYDIEVYDSLGDGWSYGITPHGIEIWSAGELLFNQSLDNFGTTLAIPLAFKTNGLLNTGAVNNTPFTLYPNPTTGMLYFNSTEVLSANIYDVTGKLVYSATNINNGDFVNLSSLLKGLYIIKLNGDMGTYSQKIILN